jgi:hypothetical protein
MKKLALALLTLVSSTATAATQDWKTEWDRTVAAAEQEGTVIVDTVSDKAWQDFVAREFPAAFPKIRLDASRLSPPDFVATRARRARSRQISLGCRRRRPQSDVCAL